MKKRAIALAVGAFCNLAWAGGETVTVQNSYNNQEDGFVVMGVETETHKVSKNAKTGINEISEKRDLSGIVATQDDVMVGISKGNYDGSSKNTGIAITDGHAKITADTIHLDSKNIQLDNINSSVNVAGDAKIGGNTKIDGNTTVNGVMHVKGGLKVGDNSVITQNAGSKIEAKDSSTDKLKYVKNKDGEDVISTVDRITTDKAVGNTKGTDLYLGSGVQDNGGKPVNVVIDESKLIVHHNGTPYDVGAGIAKIENMDRKITDVSKHASAGSASAIAHSYLAYPTGDQSGTFSMGAGHYNGQSALAMGFGASLSKQAAVKIGIAKDSYKVSYGAGFKYAW